jgi:eukaryotic-like serine/threonine-protein kinase
LLFNDVNGTTGQDVLQMNTGKPETLKPFVKTAFRERAAQFSPDGRWVAYESDATGQAEIYVTAYPSREITRQVSVGGGHTPVWHPRGGELIYQAATDLMSVAIADGMAVSPPVKLFAHLATVGLARDWAIAPDGLRFLVVDDAGITEDSRINVVLNVFDQLNESAVAGR